MNPAAVEACNGIDDDCDGAVDEGVQGTWYADLDVDGWGDTAAPLTACTQPTGSVTPEGDCDDTDPAVNPAAVEACNGVDDDCDGTVDEAGALGEQVYHPDADGDTWGSDAEEILACVTPAGATSTAGDCDDTDPAVHPGVVEVCGNDLDDDCDGGAGDCPMPPTGSVSSEAATAVFLGEAEDMHAGGAIATNGDVNGDGLTDIVLSASGWPAGSARGGVFVFLAPFAGEIPLSTADHVLEGTEEAGAGAASHHLVYAGDTDGDGLDDLLVGLSTDDTAGTDAGAAFLYRGPLTGVGTLSAAAADGAILGANERQYLTDVAKPGDHDGDGLADLVVHDSSWSQGLVESGGAVWLFSGTVDGATSLDAARATLLGSQPVSQFGHSLDGAGDVDGDGWDDLVVGAGYQDTTVEDAGAAFLFLGPLSGTHWASTAEATLSGTLEDTRASHVAGAGDVNADGYADLFVTAWDYSDMCENCGRGWLVSGPVSGEALLDDVATAIFDGRVEQDGLGGQSPTPGDVDADGFSDLLFRGANGQYSGLDCEIWLVRGPVTGWLAAGSEPDARIHTPEGCWGEHQLTGDTDGDGTSDLLIANPYADGGDAVYEVGTAWLFLGGIGG